MQLFDELGVHLDRAWEAVDFREDSFPRLAADALAAARIPDRISGDDVLQWVLEARALPPQEDLQASFGQPPITVYRGRRFYIQVLYWLDGSTTIHRHGFCGAFQVLAGGSLHSRWDFSAQGSDDARMPIGQTRLLGAELLRHGNIVEITRELTHGLFHLDPPSATIVVRTLGDVSYGPQYEYHPPTIAVDPFFVDPLVERQLQVLHLLRASAHPAWEARVVDLLKRTDSYGVFRVLNHFMRVGATTAEIDRIAELAREFHGTAIATIVLALREGLRRRALHSLRRRIRDPEGRLFLALLQNLPNRDAILNILREQYPNKEGPPLLEQLVMTHAPRLGVDTSGELERMLVAAMLRGTSEHDIFDELRTVFDDASVDSQRAEVLAQMQRIRESLLGPLFVRGAA